MKFLQLIHDKKLNLPTASFLPKLPSRIIDGLDDDGFLLSFRDPECTINCEKVRDVNACTRFLDPYDGDITCYYLSTDSFLSPLIFWDLAHSLRVGKSITLYDSNIRGCYLLKDYYKNSFRIDYIKDDVLKLVKTDRLLAELEPGLDNWTFGIPTGPGDATFLNKIVQRILSFHITHKEIILCGRPGPDFKYWDNVLIVGEEITAPPVQISKKKNCIVTHAKYNNICILHDRVYLPRNFVQAVQTFGDCFPITGFQSLYFDDYWNLTPKRYSDINLLEGGNYSSNVKGISGQRLSTFTSSTLSTFEEHNGFAYANPIRYERNSYITGSLYMVKREIWNHYPQDENLKWEEFEDVEYGLRLSELGIPCRINPYSFTQSLMSRSCLIYGGRIKSRKADGNEENWRSKFELLVKRRKPLFKLTENEAITRIKTFADKYCQTNFNETFIPKRPFDQKQRIKAIIEVTLNSKFELTIDAITRFVNDFSSMVLLNQTSKGFKDYITKAFIFNMDGAKSDCLNYGDMINQQLLRPNKYVFCNSQSDFFVKESITVKIGTILTAILLNMKNKDYLYHPLGVKGYYQSIIESTPFLDNEESNEDRAN